MMLAARLFGIRQDAKVEDFGSHMNQPMVDHTDGSHEVGEEGEDSKEVYALSRASSDNSAGVRSLS
jgi:hypothetical protein